MTLVTQRILVLGLDLSLLPVEEASIPVSMQEARPEMAKVVGVHYCRVPQPSSSRPAVVVPHKTPKEKGLSKAVSMYLQVVRSAVMRSVYYQLLAKTVPHLLKLLARTASMYMNHCLALTQKVATVVYYRLHGDKETSELSFNQVARTTLMTRAYMNHHLALTLRRIVMATVVYYKLADKETSELLLKLLARTASMMKMYMNHRLALTQRVLRKLVMATVVYYTLP